MGVVRRSVGSGQEAGAILIAEPAAPLDAALRLHVATRAFPVAQVVETRVLLESWAVSRAALADAPLDEVRALLEKMDAPDIDVREFLRLDAELHVAIAALSGNAVVAQMMTSLRSSIENYVVAAIPVSPTGRHCSTSYAASTTPWWTRSPAARLTRRRPR